MRRMGLSEKQEETLKQMPIIKTDVLRSKDGKWLIHKTTITHIKPVSYYKAIIEKRAPVEEAPIEEELQAVLG